MKPEDLVTKLNDGLPREIRDMFVLSGITSHVEFLNKLRKHSDNFERNKRQYKPLNPNAPTPALQAIHTNPNEAVMPKLNAIESQMRGLERQMIERAAFTEPRPPFSDQRAGYSGNRNPRAPFQQTQNSYVNQEPVCYFCKLPGHMIETCPNPRCKVSAAYRAQINEQRRSFRPRNNNSVQQSPTPQHQYQNHAVPVTMQTPVIPQYIQYPNPYTPQYVPQYTHIPPSVYAPNVMQNQAQPFPITTQSTPLAPTNTAGPSTQPIGTGTEQPKN
jgi:hypothetical protein